MKALWIISERTRNICLRDTYEPWHVQSRSHGLFPVGRQVFRSVNDGGPDGLATVGCDQAEGSPKGEAPVAGVAQLRIAVTDFAARRQARVRKRRGGSEGQPITLRTGPSRVSCEGAWDVSYVLCSGTHQRPSSREQGRVGLALGPIPTGYFSERPDDFPSRRLSPKNLRASWVTPANGCPVSPNITFGFAARSAA